MKVPHGLEWWRASAEGAAWLDRLPRLVAECAEAWSLRLGPPFESAARSYVALATLTGGVRAVLKINFPEVQSERQADALALWDGDGSARLLAHDAGRRALLVELCEPGIPLSDQVAEAEGNRIAAGLLTRLWGKPVPKAHSFRPLAADTERWAVALFPRWERHRPPVTRALVEEAVALCDELANSQPDLVVCHQDFRAENILAATRSPWLSIDPMPVVGERAFDAASLLLDRCTDLFHNPHPAQRMRRRIDQVSSELGLDRERMRGWGIVRLCLGSGGEERLVGLPHLCAPARRGGVTSGALAASAVLRGERLGSA